MKYTKVIIVLIQKVRRNTPEEYKGIIKLFNTEVLTELVNLYNHSSDDSLKMHHSTNIGSSQ
jgi:hypothetical protein